MKLWSKLIWSFALIGIIAIAINSFVLIQHETMIMEERIQSQLESIVILKVENINRWIDHRILDIESFSNMANLKNNLIKYNFDKDEIYKENIRSIFIEDRKIGKDFIEYYIIDLEGKVIVSTNKDNEEKIRSNMKYFIEGKNHSFVQNFYYSVSLQKPIMTVSTPIIDNNGTLIGVLAADLNINEISKIMTERTGLEKGGRVYGETYIVNKFNFVVTELLEEKINTMKKTIHTKAVNDCFENRNKNPVFIKGYLNYNNERVLGVYHYVENREVCVIGEINEKTALDPINRIRDSILIVAFIVIVALLISIHIFTGVITRPIVELKNAAEKIGKGKLKTKINIKSNDEIGELAQSFSKMTSELRKSQKQLKNYAKNLEKKVNERTRDLNKSKKDLEIRAKELDQQRIATLNVLEDVEETREKLKKSYKDLKVMDKLKDEFMNIAAHELKTPLIPVIGYLDMILSNKKLPRDVREKLEVVLRNAHREKKLVDDVLDITKLEAGVMKFEMGIVNLNELIKNSISDMQTFAKEKNLQIITKLSDKPLNVKGDSYRLTQVIENLINNAIKFTEKGSVTIETKRDKKNAIVKVTDTGIGIDKKNFKNLFTKFYQIETSAERKYGGTGLGLAICLQIIKAHKGKIWVDSQLGKGSTFTFSLPLK